MAEEEVDQEEELSKPLYKNPLYISVFGFFLLSLIAAFLVLGTGSRPEPQDETEQTAVIEDPDGVLTGALLRIEPITANIESVNTFLRLRVVYEYYELELPDAAPFHVARLKDSVLTVLRNKTSQELLSPSGKAQLRFELLDAANEALDAEDDIVNVYFEQYVLQTS